MQLLIEYASRAELVALGDHVVVRIVDGHHTESADFDRLEAAIIRRMDDARAFGVLHVSWHGTPTPSPEVQRYGAQMVDRYAERACVVIAVLGLGFWSAALLSAMGGFTRMLKFTRVRVETSIDAAARALAEDLVGLDATALVSAYEELHRHMRSLDPQ